MSCEKTSFGIALSEEDLRVCSELISEIIANLVKEIGEALDIAFNAAFQCCTDPYEALQAALKEAKDLNMIRTDTPPKKRGMSLRSCPRRTSVHYNYIPRAPRNLPYMRRAY